METETRIRVSRRTWMWGGTLLLAATLLGFSTASFHPGAPATAALSPFVFGAACIVFAVGGGRDTSVTARKPVGTGALILLGAWTPLSSIAGLVLTSATPDLLRTFSIVDGVLSFALGLVAVVSIGRAAVVPVPWNWAPSWCLAAITAVCVADAALIAVPSPDPAVVAPLLAFLGALLSAGSTLGLGVLAVLLATLPRRH